MAKSVKLGDIAAIVGVSTVTVSKALSDQKGVSEELRAQIKQLADEMGYQSPSEIRKKTAKKSIILVFSFKRYTLESIRRSIGSYIRYLTKGGGKRLLYYAGVCFQR